MIILFVVPVFYGFQSHSKPKGRFFWFVEGWGCFIYLASGNQKNRPFGAIPLFLRNQPPLKMSPIGIQLPPLRRFRHR